MMTTNDEPLATLDDVAAERPLAPERVRQMPPEALKPLRLVLAGDFIGRAAIL